MEIKLKPRYLPRLKLESFTIPVDDKKIALRSGDKTPVVIVNPKDRSVSALVGVAVIDGERVKDLGVKLLKGQGYQVVQLEEGQKVSVMFPNARDHIVYDEKPYTLASISHERPKRATKSRKNIDIRSKRTRS